MQNERMFEIVYMLLDRKKITARELSEYFGVSVRTIYRDIEKLSMAGIPVYATKGKNGGISIIDNYVLDKSVFSKKEQEDIITALEGLKQIDYPEIDPIINKLSGIFGKTQSGWIEVDFSGWGEEGKSKEIFETLKNAIIQKESVAFKYHNSKGESRERVVEPLKLIYKGNFWYLIGYCTDSLDYRVFKLSRIEDASSTGKIFERDVNDDLLRKVSENYSNHTHINLIPLSVKISEKMAFRVYDEALRNNITKIEDGYFYIDIKMPENEWMYSYLLSFFDELEVITPHFVRDKLFEIGSKLSNKYKK